MNTLAQRMPLIPVAAVRAVTGLRRDAIYDRVDGKSLLHPALLWVWDFSTTFPDNEIRDLRFWREEITADEAKAPGIAKLRLAEVIQEILPASRRNFHSGELIQMFSLSRPSLQALRDELNGNLRGARNCLFTRGNIVALLERRWLGRQPVPGTTVKQKELTA